MGSRWKLSEDPFRDDSVCVIDVKNGWVKYKCDGGLARSMELSVFVWVYMYKVKE